jgi:hypothetical protein
MFWCDAELEGNPLATSSHRDSIAFDLSLAHANCGLCTNQLNEKMNADSDSDSNVAKMIKNLKRGKKHFERSLHYAQYIDESSGTTNRQHESYIASRLAEVGSQIRKLDKEGQKERGQSSKKEEEGAAPPAGREEARSQKMSKPPVTKRKMMRKKKK